MANWADTAYIIEGPKETLQRIYNAIEHPIVEENSSKDWEGNVLKTLGIDFESKDAYMRGFIRECYLEDNYIRIYAEEAWGLTDFKYVLEDNIPDIKIYYIVEEIGCEIYATNDKEGKYFSERYFVDAEYKTFELMEYYNTEEEVLNAIKELTEGEITTWEQIDNFTDDNYYINVYKYSITED